MPSPTICHEVMGPDMMIFVFWMLHFKPAFSLSSFTFIKTLFSSFLLSAIKVMSSAYLSLLIFLLAILIPACASSSSAFCMMYSASVQFTRSVISDCDPMACSMPGLPVHHQLLEFTQTQVHWVGDAIQPSHPLLVPSPPAFNLSQHQGLFRWVSSLHQVAKVLEF